MIALAGEPDLFGNIVSYGSPVIAQRPKSLCVPFPIGHGRGEQHRLYHPEAFTLEGAFSFAPVTVLSPGLPAM